MAEKEALSVGNDQSREALSAQSGLAAPSAGAHGVLEDRLSFTTLDSNSERPVQPFPRSPKLQKKMAKAAQPSQVMMQACSEAFRRQLFHSFEMKSICLL